MTLEEFAEVITQQQQARLVEQGLDCEANMVGAVAHVVPGGKKYTKIDLGRGQGKFMVEIATGIIYGIKAYGQVHKGHMYGTLETVDEWFWGDYYPSRRA